MLLSKKHMCVLLFDMMDFVVDVLHYVYKVMSGCVV